MTRLERLTVDELRGIVHSELPFDGGSIVLGGANGTGKTGFVDAIELLFTGNIGPLTGVAGLSLREHAPHVNAMPGSTRVAASFVEPSGTIARLLQGPVDVPVSLEPFFRRGGAATFILRRSQLQEFIHARPAERYKQIADLIGAEALDRTDLAMKRARDQLETELQELEARIAGLERRLAEIPEEQPQEEILAEATSRLHELGFGELELRGVNDLSAARGAILRSVTRPEPDPKEVALRALSGELERGIGLDHLREEVAGYREMLPGPLTPQPPHPSRQSRRGTRQGARGSPSSGVRAVGGATKEAGTSGELLDLIQILQRGREYLRETESHACPLCEQSIQPRRVLSQLVERIAGLEEVNLQRERLERARSDLSLALQEVSARLRAVERAAREAGQRTGPTEALGNAITMLQESLRGGASREQLEMSDRLEDVAERWALWRRETLEAVPPIDETDGRDESAHVADEALAVLQYATAQIAQGSRGQEERARLCREIAAEGEIGRRQQAVSLARIVYATYLRVKNDEIQRVFDELQSDLVRFYDVLHPGEGHSGLAIAMDLRKRGSAELRMAFHGRREENPRAFSSEGHLDSLGLCIFLAFFARFNGDWPLLVLDDVVSSIDAAHKRRVADLLFEEFGDRQLFITTHDSRWFADLQRAETGSGHGGDVKNLVIDSWSLEEGPKLREMKW